MKKNKAVTKQKKKLVREYRDPYTFDPFETWVWRSYEGNDVINLSEFIANNRESLFFIGTDSQSYKGRTCTFTSVLIAYKMGRGGTIARHTDKRAIVPREALSAKLTVETQRSIELCKFVEENLMQLSMDDDVDYMKNLVGISIDVNYDEMKGKSGRYKDMLVGMVVAYGWNAFIKPDSFAASAVADKKC